MEIFEDQAIAGLDLEPIKRKLMRGKPAAPWSRERVDAAETEYRRFLYLMKLFPNELAVPSMDVDRFWHQHIVETAKYARDCEAVFGYFLHRHPYVGLGADDAAMRLQAGKRMRELYRQVFGPLADESAAAESAHGFDIAIRSISQTQARTPFPIWAVPGDDDHPDEPEEPDEANDEDGDLLDQLRFVVIENQRYDRVAEPVM